MNNNMEIGVYEHEGCSYRIYRTKKDIAISNRLVCIHGAGVAGQLTFDYIVRYLKEYSEVLVPDLPGMGDSGEPEELHPPVNHYINAVCSIINHENWKGFDLCGYSLGGLLAAKMKSEHRNSDFKIGRLTLIEPALFDDVDIIKTKEFRKHYKQVAEAILTGINPEEGIVQFLDLVSPNRTKNPRAEQVAIRRLGSRSKGFAQALYAVALESEQIDRSRLIKTIQPVTIIAGQNSHPGMLQFHKKLAESEASWGFIVIPGCDHSLPYQKPKRIAELLEL